MTCGQCNERKGDRFPIEAGGCRVTFETRDTRKTEPRLLIDLVDDPVDKWLVVDVDEDGDHYAEIAPREEFDPFSKEAFRVSETIELFALNDDEDLLQERVRALDRLTRLHRAGKLDQLRKRASRYCCHCLTVRSFIETYAPDLFPDATSELQWFMGRLCRRLLSLLDRRERRGRKSDALLRRASEIAWTLAYLWKDPPVGTAEDVARFLEQNGCKERVQRYYVKLGAGEPAPETEGC
ncbi:hypothetical protein A7982_13295 [Minicystis rosea]|nr:hypothetical protein A7982_13295 [Minicystis rosea]